MASFIYLFIYLFISEQWFSGKNRNLRYLRYVFVAVMGLQLQCCETHGDKWIYGSHIYATSYSFGKKLDYMGQNGGLF